MAILTKGTTFADGDQVTSAKLNDLVDAAAFASDAVDDATIQLSAGKIAVKTIQTANIANSAVTSDKIGTGSVIEAKIGAGAVTTDKLATDAVTEAKISDDSVTTAKIADANVTPAKLSQPFTIETAKATTSGTEVDFTSIPSWVKRITVGFIGVSTNGSSPIQIQIGDSGGFETTGYDSKAFFYNSGTDTASTSGLIVNQPQFSSDTNRGFVTLVKVDGNNWAYSGTILSRTSSVAVSAGIKELSSTLDRIRITTVNGTDAFDAGSVNVLYE